MDSVTLSRWQFGITTVYHFLFVPITIALSMLVAVLQTIWYKTGQDRFLQLTKFFGKLFLINFALGVVTGLVQEFQFGMNWSEYSRFVGDIFGAPLALEALLAFFLESTFIGLWIFGWDKLPKKVHLAAIYLAAIGTNLSAVFILAANSWMQHPVGSVFNTQTGRAELDGISGFFELFTNPVFLATFPHTITAAYMVAGGLVAGISFWHLAKLNSKVAAGTADDSHIATWRWAAKFGAWVLLVASAGVMLSGDLQSKAMTEAQPMKMATAEGLFETERNASFSVLTIGDIDGRSGTHILRVPGLLSLLAGHEEVQGITNLEKQFHEEGFKRNDGTRLKLQEQVAQAVKDGTISPEIQLSFLDVDPVPMVALSYWTFRLMIGVGLAGIGISLLMLLQLRRGRNPKAGWWPLFVAWALPLLPLAGNSLGWIFTEMGRQPWLVAGVLPTAAAVSPNVSAGSVLFSMIVYTVLYGCLAVLELWLFLKYTKAGLPEAHPVEVQDDPDQPMTFAY
ncbi:cytochrome ubiquinol oxidase subunit I [Tessaracoccus sp. OH4464_COT-324]|uniref:cytochrome ubiquinol oxidase subunit I n=1 Tax=Tessaracoccus sp. OH4464_COT-324 TaxID=2491059 RepID=UPI000F63C061|nr:cytochrome ubiquinol oxidase subunit I [Tessaracoccus sp. OH4464_COT-324]RRD47256.1 cytochrome ubiquinol oxidase subunit I [Tessaracoccus sp. OH4464_COT-324]